MDVQETIRQWDRGSKNGRIAILMKFIKRHRNSTGAEIEKDLGHASILFFTRITAWLRLTYQLGYELSVQLTALSLFLQGQKFLTAFMESGGIQTLTDIVCHASKHKDDKNNALLMLIHIANSGRVYREMVCDGSGVDMLVKATLHEEDERTLELTASLFMSLGQGNPRKSALVHSGLVYITLHGNEAGALCGATTLRSLQLSKQYYSTGVGQQLGSAPSMVGAESGSPEAADVLLSAFFHLIASESVKLRFEGTELLSIAAHNGQLVTPIVTQALEILDNDVDVDLDNARKVAGLRQQAACARVIANIIVNAPGDNISTELLMLLDRRGAYLILSKILRNASMKDIATQKECCKALVRLAAATRHTTDQSVSNVGQWLKDRVGDEMVDLLYKKNLEFSDELVVEVGAALRQAYIAEGGIEGPKKGETASGEVSSRHSPRASPRRGGPPAVQFGNQDKDFTDEQFKKVVEEDWPEAESSDDEEAIAAATLDPQMTTGAK